MQNRKGLKQIENECEIGRQQRLQMRREGHKKGLKTGCERAVTGAQEVT